MVGWWWQPTHRTTIKQTYVRIAYLVCGQRYGTSTRSHLALSAGRSSLAATDHGRWPGAPGSDRACLHLRRSPGSPGRDLPKRRPVVPAESHPTSTCRQTASTVGSVPAAYRRSCQRRLWARPDSPGRPPPPNLPSRDRRHGRGAQHGMKPRRRAQAAPLRHTRSSVSGHRIRPGKIMSATTSPRRPLPRRPRGCWRRASPSARRGVVGSTDGYAGAGHDGAPHALGGGLLGGPLPRERDLHHLRETDTDTGVSSSIRFSPASPWIAAVDSCTHTGTGSSRRATAAPTARTGPTRLRISARRFERVGRRPTRTPVRCTTASTSATASVYGPSERAFQCRTAGRLAGMPGLGHVHDDPVLQAGRGGARGR